MAAGRGRGRRRASHAAQGRCCSDPRQAITEHSSDLSHADEFELGTRLFDLTCAFVPLEIGQT